MMLSAVLGFIVGQACGDNFRHRKCLEQRQELRDYWQIRSCGLMLGCFEELL